MTKPHRRNILLKLPSILYGWGVALRNIAFDNGFLRSEEPMIPTICVGNISVGGTGKSPHIEMLVRLLKSSYRICVLSRGYGRIGDDPRMVREEDRSDLVGDEPLQIKRKFPDLMVYVDGNRFRAVKYLETLPLEQRPTLILMDDGFQHRYVKPSHSILLTPYDCPFTRDALLPYGNLRETEAAKYRANTVIVSKCPAKIKPIDKQLLEGELELHAHQRLYYSTVRYLHPRRVVPIPEQQASESPKMPAGAATLLLAGIANPEPFFTHCVKEKYAIRHRFVFKDHHRFSKADVDLLHRKIIENEDLYLLCTEKDAVRLRSYVGQWSPSEQRRCFYLPIEVSMNGEHLSRLRRSLLNDIKMAQERIAQRRREQQ